MLIFLCNDPRAAGFSFSCLSSLDREDEGAANVSRNAAAAAAAQFCAGRRGDTAVSLLFAAMQTAVKVIPVWPHQECSEMAVASILRHDRNRGGLWLSCDGFPSVYISLTCVPILKTCSSYCACGSGTCFY